MEPDSGDAVILMRNYNFGATNLEEAARDLLQRLQRSFELAER